MGNIYLWYSKPVDENQEESLDSSFLNMRLMIK